MKILIDCFIPIESAPVFSLGFAKGLLYNHVEVYAILSENIENKSEWIDLLGLEHLWFLKKGLSFRQRPFFSVCEYLRLFNHFRKVQFDYIFETFPSGELERISKIMKYRESFGICHDVIPHSSTGSDITERINKAFNKVDNIVVLSKQFKKAAIERFQVDDTRVYYLRHGAMTYPSFTMEADYSRCKYINYLYFGRIDGYKGLHVLSKAYNQLAQEEKNISLTVAGSGDFSEYRDEYKELPNCTVVNRYLNDDDISYYFNMPNVVLVLPYIDATQSGVIGMAFNYKTPVIVSDTGGLKEQLFDGEMGSFVTPGDSQGLYKEMKKFITEKTLMEEQRKLMGVGYQKSTWEYCVKEFLNQIEIQ